MKALEMFTVRPYFAHECDSTGGFNNGYYLDEIHVFATDADDAVYRAQEKFIEDNKTEFNFDRAEFDSQIGDIYWEGPWFVMTWKVDRETCMDAMSDGDDSAHYLYQFISFEV